MGFHKQDSKGKNLEETADKLSEITKLSYVKGIINKMKRAKLQLLENYLQLN